MRSPHPGTFSDRSQDTWYHQSVPFLIPMCYFQNKPLAWIFLYIRSCDQVIQEWNHSVLQNEGRKFYSQGILNCRYSLKKKFYFVSVTKSRSLTKTPITRWVSTINHLFRGGGGGGWWRGSYPFIKFYYMPTNKGKTPEMILQMCQESRRLDCIIPRLPRIPNLVIFNDWAQRENPQSICEWLTHAVPADRGWRQQKWQQVTLIQSSQSCPALRDPMDCSTPGSPVLHHLPEFAQTHVHWVSDGIQPSSVIPFSSCPPSVPASGSFPMSGFFTSGGQRISASASVLPANTQGWFPSGLTGLTSLQSKGLSRVSPTPQFKSIYSLAPSLLHGPPLTSIQDHWKNHSLV